MSGSELSIDSIDKGIALKPISHPSSQAAAQKVMADSLSSPLHTSLARSALNRSMQSVLLVSPSSNQGLVPKAEEETVDLFVTKAGHVGESTPADEAAVTFPVSLVGRSGKTSSLLQAGSPRLQMIPSGSAISDFIGQYELTDDSFKISSIQKNDFEKGQCTEKQVSSPTSSQSSRNRSSPGVVGGNKAPSLHRQHAASGQPVISNVIRTPSGHRQRSAFGEPIAPTIADNPAVRSLDVKQSVDRVKGNVHDGQSSLRGSSDLSIVATANQEASKKNEPSFEFENPVARQRASSEGDVLSQETGVENKIGSIRQILLRFRSALSPKSPKPSKSPSNR
jgi:hypothetical protein